MSTIEKILKFKKTGQPFWIFLANGQKFGILGNAWLSMHPSNHGLFLTVYCDEVEEYLIPVLDVRRVSLSGA